MPIYDFKGQKQTALHMEAAADEFESPYVKRVNVFSFVSGRFFLLFLFLADLLWMAYGVFRFIIAGALCGITLGKINAHRESFTKAYVSMRRAFVCGISLLIALIIPAFGIMMACTYFLMYDKSGIDEVIPSYIHTHFKDLFKPS